MLSITEAADMVRRKPVTIRQWLFKRRIFPDGLDEQNRPLFRPETVREAEALVRRNGIEGNGSDPRRARPKQAPAEDDLEGPGPDVKAVA